MPKYKVSGTVKITYSWLIVDEVIEGDDEEDALDGLLEDCEPHDAFDTDYDTFSLSIEEIEEQEVSEAQRMAALGMPMLPGFTA